MYLLVAQQASAVLQWAINKELKAARAHAYEATIESRGKDKSFWIPYVEEWKVPPTERAKRSMERKGFLMKAGNPWIKLLIMRSTWPNSAPDLASANRKPSPASTARLHTLPGHHRLGWSSERVGRIAP